MIPIIDPIDKEIIKGELTKEHLFRKTNKGGNEIYVINYHNAPNTVREIGRLREEAFRDAGGGSGKELDLDEFDTMKNPYHQLIVWNPDSEEILGGYRFMFGDEVKLDSKGQPILSTSHLYRYSEQFIQKFLSKTIELGRSFVTLGYQSSKQGAKALYALDNLWDGLGALSILRPKMRYFFGKITMYPSYPQEARDMILYFWQKHFPDHSNLLKAKIPLVVNYDKEKLEEIFTNSDFMLDFKVLNKEVRALGVNIPPLVNAYTMLSKSMRYFDTAINHEFGDVEESAIIIKIAHIVQDKRDRHMETYSSNPLFKMS